VLLSAGQGDGGEEGGPPACVFVCLVYVVNVVEVGVGGWVGHDESLAASR